MFPIPFINNLCFLSMNNLKGFNIKKTHNSMLFCPKTQNSMLFCPKSQNSMLFCPKHITACCYVKKNSRCFFLFLTNLVFTLTKETEPSSRFIQIMIANGINYYTFAHLFKDIEDSYYWSGLWSWSLVSKRQMQKVWTSISIRK